MVHMHTEKCAAFPRQPTGMPFHTISSRISPRRLVPMTGVGLNDGDGARRRALEVSCDMIDPKTLDALVKRIAEGLPAGFGQVQEDLRNNLHAAVSAALARMDLVPRDEFDVQSAVLARTREKLTALEAKVAELERALDADQRPGSPTKER